jgi:hypothetical protein
LSAPFRPRRATRAGGKALTGGKGCEIIEDMKKILIALAILLAFCGPAQAQATEADDPILDDCNAIRREIEKDKTRHPAHALFIEGVSRFYGYCHRRDVRRGLAMAERGVIMGLDGQASAIGEMYRTIGNLTRAEIWFEIAAMAAIFAERRSPSILNPVHLLPPAQAQYDRLRRALDEPDLAELVATLERLNGRAPILALVESSFWNRAAGQLRRADRLDYYYWETRFYLVYGGSRPSALTHPLEIALNCGEARTIREFAARFVDEHAPFGDPRKIAEGVARLHLRTGSDGELLARVETRLGRAAYESPEALRQGVRRAANECSLIAPRAR